MNLIDAYFMHPVALDHARAVLHVELYPYEQVHLYPLTT